MAKQLPLPMRTFPLSIYWLVDIEAEYVAWLLCNHQCFDYFILIRPSFHIHPLLY